MTSSASVAAAGRPAGRRDTRRRLLIAVGPSARQAAGTDQRAAGRERVEAGSVAEAAESLSADARSSGARSSGAGAVSSALVALSGDSLTYAALESLLGASVETGVPVGVLPVGADGRLLGAGREPAPPAPRVGAMYGHFHERYGCGTEFGRQEVDGFLRLLSGGVEAAVLHVHGNGADLQLGNQVMCVQADGLRGTPMPGDLTLPCQAGGPCRLEHLPLTAYWGASAMRARIAVLVSCWGYHPADGVLSPEAQLGAALFRGGNVESFIASTRVTFNTPQLARAALAFLELGGTAGELTLLLNRFPGTATPPYVCVGDPDVRVRLPGDGRHARHACSPGEAPEAPEASAVSETSGDGPAGSAGPEDFLDFGQLSRLERATRAAAPEVREEILAGFGPVLKEGRRARIGATVQAEPALPEPEPAPDQARLYRGLTALVARHTGDLPKDVADTFWDLIHTDQGAGQRADQGADPAVGALDQRWCQVQARLLRRRGPEQLGYLSSGSVYRDERLEPDRRRARHLCGNRMFRITVEFTAVGGYRRELAFCERCGPVADVPAGMPAPFATAGYGGVRVIGARWENAWATCGVVSVGFSRFPASEPRLVRLAEPIPLPPDIEPGRRLGIALVSEGEHILLETGLPREPRPDRESTNFGRGSTNSERESTNSADVTDERSGQVSHG